MSRKKRGQHAGGPKEFQPLVRMYRPGYCSPLVISVRWGTHRLGVKGRSYKPRQKATSTSGRRAEHRAVSSDRQGTFTKNFSRLLEHVRVSQCWG